VCLYSSAPPLTELAGRLNRVKWFISGLPHIVFVAQRPKCHSFIQCFCWNPCFRVRFSGLLLLLTD
jgi:hypothetical protein